MNIFAQMWEGIARTTIKINGVAIFTAIICISIGVGAASIIKITKTNSADIFTLVIVGFWMGGIAMINYLYYPDTEGTSQMQRASIFNQYYGSIFWIVWFALLTFATIHGIHHYISN